MPNALRTPARFRIGWFIAQALFSATTCIEIYYYSDWLVNIAFVPLALIAIIKTTTAVLDCASAVALPAIMQKLRLPWGKYRSYFAIFPVIYCIFGALAIAKVSDTSMTLNAIVLIGSYFISRFMWNLTDSASSTFTTVAAEEYPDAQTTLSMWRGRGSASSSLWFGALSGPLLALIIGITKSDVWSYTVLALVWFIVNIIGYQILFFTTKSLKKRDMAALEVGVSGATKVTFKDMLKAVGTNRALLTIWVYDIFRQLGMFYASGVSLFYFRYSLKLPDAPVFMSTYILVTGACSFAGSFVAAFIVKKLGTKGALLLSMFGGAAVGVVLYLLNIKDAWVVTAIRCVTALFLGSSLVLITKTYADCSIYGEYKTGKDVRPTVMSTFTIPIKIMSIIIGLVTTAAVAYAFMGTSPEAVASDITLVTETMMRRFDIIFFIYPAVFSAIAGVAMLFFPADKKFLEWGKVNAERRAALADKA